MPLSKEIKDEIEKLSREDKQNKITAYLKPKLENHEVNPVKPIFRINFQ